MLNQVPPAEVLECAPDENHALLTVGLETSDGPVDVPGDERCLDPFRFESLRETTGRDLSEHNEGPRRVSSAPSGGCEQLDWPNGGKMTITSLNAFCRRYDLIFVEMGRVKGEDVYWFIDFNNRRCFYSAPEIKNKIIAPLVAS